MMLTDAITIDYDTKETKTETGCVDADKQENQHKIHKILFE